MPSSHTRAALFVQLFLLAGLAPIEAQWSISAGVRAARFAGGAEEIATGHALGPYRPTMWEVGADRSAGRVGVGLRLRYASSSLALEGDEAVAVVKDALSVVALDPEASLRLASTGAGAVFRLYGGPVLEVWKLPDLGSRFRAGVAGALGVEVPLGGRWSGGARLGAAFSASPFDEADLEAGFRRRVLLRREAGATIRYRL